MKKSIYIVLLSIIVFSCNNAKKETQVVNPKVEDLAKVDYEAIGLKYVFATKRELGKNLMGTIAKKGTNAAVSFCNEKAYFLTNSVSNAFNANIKRVSDKPRNPDNTANTTELTHIETFKNRLANNQDLKPIFKENEDNVNFYYPIITNGMCLQCHGSKDVQIKPNVYKTLEELYPKDKAIGYSDNQVRGIWSISFKK
jgi:hypothetical protein